MMKIIGLSLISAVLYCVLKKYSPEYSVFAEVSCIVLILFLSFPYMKDVINFFYKYFHVMKYGDNYLDYIVKIVGVAIISQFSSDICRDSGQVALAQQVEFAGKVIMVGISIPIAKTILEVAMAIIEIE